MNNILFHILTVIFSILEQIEPITYTIHIRLMNYFNIHLTIKPISIIFYALTIVFVNHYASKRIKKQFANNNKQIKLYPIIERVY